MTGQTRRWISTQKEVSRVNVDVARERQRQNEKWGLQHHAPEWWLTILAEEVGELAKEIVELKFGEGDPSRMKDELVQVAAVALAWLADHDGRVAYSDDPVWPDVLDPDPDRWWER